LAPERIEWGFSEPALVKNGHFFERWPAAAIREHDFGSE